MKPVLNTALVGFGLSGQAFHAPFLHVHNGFSLTQVVERNKMESAKTYPYVQVVKTLDEVLENDEIDLVVIATPNTLHFDQVSACLESGKHVVIEKPFMNSVSDCETIMEMANKKGLNLFIFHNRRWDGDFLTIEKILHSGILGVPEYYEAHFDRYSPTRTRAAWRDEDNPGSGILYDLGPHLIDQALKLFGMPKTIKADIEIQRPGGLVDDYFRLELTYKDMEAVLTAGMLVEEPDLRYVLHGENGSYIKYGIDPQENLLRQGIMPGGIDWGKEDPAYHGLITLDDESEDFDGMLETLPGNYMGFYDNVYNALTSDTDIAVSAMDARNGIHLIELAFESNKQGKKLNV